MIEINNLTKTRIEEKRLKQAAEAALEEIKKTLGLARGKEAEVSLALVGGKRMRALNKTYRGKDKPTDVLSFSQIERGKKFVKAPEKIIRLGEVVVCLPVARKQAKRSKHSLLKELTILLIHGILHLAGYEHERSAREAKKMEKTQSKIMEIIK